MNKQCEKWVSNFFEERKVEFAFLYPTKTGLTKSIFDATAPIIEFLEKASLHRYRDQEQGQNNKKKIQTSIFYESLVEETFTSFYRPMSKKGDPRLWPRHIIKYVAPGQVLVLFKFGAGLGIANCDNVIWESVSRALDLSAETSALSQYETLNHAIGSVITSGTFSFRDIYLDFEDDLKDKIAQSAGCQIEELERKILDATKEKLDFSCPNPLRPISVELSKWIEEGRKALPPTLPFLCSLTIAAEKMATDTGTSQNNFYGRLNEILQLEGEDRRLTENKNFKVTEEFWKEFNTWLRLNDGRFGFPTAHPIIKQWRYVSYGISQALVRDGDKKRLSQTLTESKKLRLSQAKDPEHVFDVLDPVLSRQNMTTKYLHRLWSNDELKPTIIEAALAELARVDFNECSGRIGQALKLQISEKKFPLPSIKIVLGLPVSEPPQPDCELTPQDRTIFFENPHLIAISDNFSVLGPPEAFSIEHALASSFELESFQGSGALFSFIPRQMYALQKESSKEFVQRDRPDLFTETVILAKRSRKNKERLLEFLKTTASPNFEVVEAIRGLPENFFMVRNVFFVHPVSRSEYISDQNDPLYWLCPKAPFQGLVINGGLRLNRNIFHASSKVEILFPSKSLLERVKITRNSSPELKLLKNQHGVISLTLEGPDKEVQIDIPDGNFRSQTISFRSSEDVNPDISSSYSYLVTANSWGILSASEVDEDAGSIISGMSIDNWKQLTTSSDLSNHKIGAEVPSNENQTAEIIYRSASHSDRSQTCVEREHHYWICEEDGRSGICKDCGEARSWPSAKPASQHAKKVEIFRPEAKFTRNDAAENKVGVEDVYDAVCYLQEVSWAKFRDFAKTLFDDKFYPSKLAHAYASLGHVDICLDPATLITKKIVCCPPVLYETDQNYVFSGFRNPALEKNISDVLGRDLREFKDQTDVFNQLSLPKQVVEQNIDNLISVRDDFDRLLKVEKNFGQKLSEALPNLRDVYQHLPLADFSSKSLERFDPLTGRWESTDSVVKVGAYRQRWPMNFYFLKMHDGTTRASTVHLAKIFAADVQKIILHDYDKASRNFCFSIGNELPGLFHRVIVACSGRYPLNSSTTMQVRAEEVPPQIYNNIIQKLYGQV